MAKDWSTVKRYFETDAVAHIATLMPDGSPHTVPVWVGLEGERLAVFTQADTRKDRNLQRDARVAISITAPGNPLDSAFVRGQAVERIDGDEAMTIIDRISQKYTGEPYPERTNFAAFLIEPTVSWSQDYTDD